MALAAASSLLLLSVPAIAGAESTAGALSGWPGWPTFLHDNRRSGYNPDETTITPANAHSLKVRWSRLVSSVTAQPVVVGQGVYFGGWNGYEHRADTSGSLRWGRDLHQATSQCDGTTYGVTSTAAVGMVGGRRLAFVGTGNARLVALAASTGEVVWRTRLGRPPAAFMWSSPALYDGSVYIGMASMDDCPLVRGGVFQLDAATGAIQHRWYAVPPGCVGASVWSSPTVDARAGTIYVTTGNPGEDCSSDEPYAEAMVELRASDLALLGSWGVPDADGVEDGDFGATPTLFTASLNGQPTPMVGAVNKNGTYYAFIRDHVSDGPAWQVAVTEGRDISSSSFDGHALYVAGGRTDIGDRTCTGGVRALDPATGTFLWEACLSHGPIIAPVTSAPGLVIVAANKHQIVLNAADGSTLFDYRDPTQQPFFGPPSISGGVIYEGGMDGRLYAFGL